MRVELQLAYVLHSRPYSDSSLIIDCLTPDFGRVSLLAKGARSAKSKQRNLLQPFLPLSVSWQGKSNLKTLIGAETQSLRVPLQGKSLYCAFYLNELLVRLLPEQDALPEVLPIYQQALEALSSAVECSGAPVSNFEVVLRSFERQLLQLLGYEINFLYEALSSELISANAYYRYEIEHGFVRVNGELAGTGVGHSALFCGEQILALAGHDYSQPLTLHAAKCLMRTALKPLLGHKPLQSRKLFVDMVSSSVEA